MALTPVQTVTGTAATSATTISLAINSVAAGNTLVMIGAANGITSAAISSITDSQGNTVNTLPSKRPGTLTSAVAQAAYILAASSGTHTITYNLSGAASAGGSIIIREYKQADLFAFDTHIENTGTADNPMTSTASPSTSQASESVICWCARAGATAPTVGAGFGNFIVVQDPSNNCQSILEDMAVNAIGPQTGLVNDSSPTNYACGVMTFRTAVGNPGNLLLLGCGT